MAVQRSLVHINQVYIIVVSIAPPPPPSADPPVPPVDRPPTEKRGALLSSIEGFTKGKLKKAVTNDRSAPKV